MAAELRPAPNFPGYFIDSDGELYSGKRLHKPLSKRPNRYGYLRVAVYTNGKSKPCYLHREVAIAFVGEKLPGQEVRHKNGIKTDNRAINLEWGTRLENMADRKRHGHDPVGTKNGRALLSPVAVGEIRLLVSSGFRQALIARWYNVHVTTIEHIIMGKNWPDVPAADAATNSDFITRCVERRAADLETARRSIIPLQSPIWDDLSGDDLSGKQAGYLILKRSFRDGNGRLRWYCDCIFDGCTTTDFSVLISQLRGRKTSSCGCLRKRKCRDRNILRFALENAHP